MNEYLLSVVETWRVPTVEDALKMRERMQEDSAYDLQSFTYTVKYDKKNDEEYCVVKAKKVINAEKDPGVDVEVKYELH